MNNELPTPILTPKLEVDAATVAIVRVLQAIAEDLPFMLVGATARIVLFENVFGLPKGEATRDVDFAIAVSGWDQFRDFADRLVGSGYFKRSAVMQTLIFKLPAVHADNASGLYVDLIPFGGIEEEGKKISWPPDMATVMHVVGFDDALISAHRVEIAEGLIVRVVSVPSLAVLKLLAWRNRGIENNGKDAVDFARLFNKYGSTGISERMYHDPAIGRVLEANDYDYGLAEAWLLGADAGRTASTETIVAVEEILGNQKTFEKLVDKMTQGLNEQMTFERVSTLAEMFRAGFAAQTRGLTN